MVSFCKEIPGRTRQTTTDHSEGQWHPTYPNEKHIADTRNQGQNSELKYYLPPQYSDPKPSKSCQNKILQNRQILLSVTKRK